MLSLRFRSRTGQGMPSMRGAPIGTRWMSWLEGERDRPTALYLGQARRALAEAPVADGLVRLLEAAARQTLPDWNLLLEGLDHADPTVRWTAARLIRARDVRGQLGERLRASSDPLVAAQADRPPPPSSYNP